MGWEALLDSKGDPLHKDHRTDEVVLRAGKRSAFVWANKGESVYRVRVWTKGEKPVNFVTDTKREAAMCACRALSIEFEPIPAFTDVYAATLNLIRG